MAASEQIPRIAKMLWFRDSVFRVFRVQCWGDLEDYGWMRAMVCVLGLAVEGFFWICGLGLWV